MTHGMTAEQHAARHRPDAEAGDPDAMAHLAWALWHQGDEAEAEHWYGRAARAGNLIGMTGLGYVRARENTRVARDEALGWWRRAAHGGEVHAMRYLANALPDPMEAERWRFLAEAADHDVTTEVVPDDVAAAAAELGPLRSVTGREKPERNVGLLIGGVTVGVVLEGAGLAMMLTGSPSAWVGLLLGGGVLVALLTVLTSVVDSESVPPGVWRYENGIVHRDAKGRLNVLEWSDIRVLRQVIRLNNDARAGRVGLYDYTLQHVDGHKVVLLDKTFPSGQMCALGADIERETAAVHLPRAVNAVREGRRVDFGKFSVGPDGVRHGTTFVSWHELDAIDAKQGVIRVKRKGQWLNWSTTRVDTTPNAHVLFALGQELRARTANETPGDSLEAS